MGKKGYFPETILVTDKSSFTTYLFDLSSENAYRSNGTLRYTKKFKVGTGKQEGKKRSVAGLNKKEKITPEGIFWVDRIVDKPEKVYSNGAYLGPRVISTMAPGERTPNDDIAYHGTTRRTQRTIGSAKSFGCLRMYNPEVVELYDRLDQQRQHGKGTIVIITP